MFKIAMLSGWHVHAEGYAKEVLQMPDCEISLIWDEDINRGQKWANELNVPFEADLEKVLANKEIHGVVINSPTNMHKELIIKSAKAKKHIFTEKVMATTISDCEEIIKAIEENNIIFTISLVYKAKGIFRKIKELLDKQTIGQITYGRVRNAHNGSSANWLPKYFYSKDQCGGGAMMDLGAHSMYLLNWYLGQPKSIISMFNHVTKREVEDNAVSLIEFEHNAIGVSETGFVSSDSQFLIEFSGFDGSIYANISKGIIEYKNNSMDKWETINEFEQDYNTPIRQWVLSVTTGKEVLYGVKDALELTRFMEYAYKSHEQNKKIFFK